MSGFDPHAAHVAAMAEVAKLNEGGIAIHGKRYTTVAKRVEAFRKHFGVYGRLRIADPEIGPEVVRMRALVELRDEAGNWYEVAAGFAEEVRNSSAINRTSAVEVCETSAIGRALANFGLHGGEYASANEVENAQAKAGNGNGQREPPPSSAGPTVPVGKYAGKPWADVPTEYLSEVTTHPSAPVSLKKGAQQEIERRDAARTGAH